LVALFGALLAVLLSGGLAGEALADGSAAEGQTSQALFRGDLPAPEGACPAGFSIEPPPPVIATRALQTRMMVAALTCDQRDAYGVFVTRFRTQLSVNADSLAVRFERQGGPTAVDRLVTRLANHAAADSTQDRDGFCARAGATLKRLATTPPGDLADVALDAWRAAGCPDW